MKVRCVACRQYKEKGYCVPFGLGWCCDANCRWEAIERRRQPPPSPNNVRRTKKVRLPGSDKRLIIQQRDGRKCRYCGTNKALHVHHIVYRSEHGSNDERNLVTLCLGHHDKVHSNKRHFQPVLVELIRLHYDEGLYLTVPEVERRLAAAA